MKPFAVRLSALVCVAGSLVGCATQETAPPPGTLVVDQARVAAIERAARSSGVAVIWVQMPMKRVPAGS